MTNEEAIAVLKEKYCGIGANDLLVFCKAIEALEKAEKETLTASIFDLVRMCKHFVDTCEGCPLERYIGPCPHLIFLKRTTKPSSSGVTNIRRRPTRKTSLRNFRMRKRTYPEIQCRAGSYCLDLRKETVVQETVPIAGTNACRR